MMRVSSKGMPRDRAEATMRGTIPGGEGHAWAKGRGRPGRRCTTDPCREGGWGTSGDIDPKVFGCAAPGSVLGQGNT